MRIFALDGIPEVHAGDDLPALLATALSKTGLCQSDVVIVAQKIVSKAEGRAVSLGSVLPSARARQLADLTGKDPRQIELILLESMEVMRAVPGVLITRHRIGHVMANAGIDRSNVGADEASVLLLPIDPDASARNLRDALQRLLGVTPAVIISDSFGRAWRNGTVNVAIGVAGILPLVDRRGERDRDGKLLEATEVAVADALAAAAGLVMGEGGEGIPAALVRDAPWICSDKGIDALLRPREQDLFP